MGSGRQMGCGLLDPGPPVRTRFGAGPGVGIAGWSGPASSQSQSGIQMNTNNRRQRVVASTASVNPAPVTAGPELGLDLGRPISAVGEHIVWPSTERRIPNAGAGPAVSLPVRAQAEDDRASALLWLWYDGGASVGLRLPSSKYRRKMIRTRSASSSTTTILQSFTCRGRRRCGWHLRASLLLSFALAGFSFGCGPAQLAGHMLEML